MGKRSTSRRIALQALYQSELSGNTITEALASSMEEETFPAETMRFASELAEGVSANIKDLDAAISEHSNDWKIGRMSVVDRNILRIACYELKYFEGNPKEVVIDEAVELAKKFGGEDSGSFINGILGAVVKGTKEKEKKL